MNDTGKNIVAAVNDFQALFDQIGILLQTADAQMEKREWLSRSNQCVSVSTSVENPDRWFPKFMYRVYYHKRIKSIVGFVSILLNDVFEDALLPVTEPLLSAGWYDYGKGNKASKGQYQGWTVCHVDHVNRRDDGTVMQNTDKKWLDYDKWGIESFNSLALPLVSIQSAEDLIKRVIVPINEHLEKSVK